MAKIWVFELESMLKHCNLKRDSVDGSIEVYTQQGKLVACIVGDVVITAVIQLKLDTHEVDLVKQYTKDLEVPNEEV